MGFFTKKEPITAAEAKEITQLTQKDSFLSDLEFYEGYIEEKAYEGQRRAVASEELSPQIVATLRERGFIVRELNENHKGKIYTVISW